MKATKSYPPSTLSVNAIFAVRGTSRFVHAGIPLDAETLSAMPPNIQRYLVPAESESESDQEPVASFQLGKVYSVDRNDRLRQRQVARQATEQAAAAQFQDAMEAHLQEQLENPDQTTAAAMEQIQDQHEAVVGRQIAEAAAAAKRREMDDEAAKQFIAEQDAMLIDENPVSPAIHEEPASEWKPKPRKMRVRFLCRNGVWLRAKRVKNLRIAEPVFVRDGPGDFVQIGKVNSKKHLPVSYVED